MLVKLNKIYSLEHEYYNNTEDLPDGFPDRVKGLLTTAKNDAERNQGGAKMRIELREIYKTFKNMKSIYFRYICICLYVDILYIVAKLHSIS